MAPSLTGENDPQVFRPKRILTMLVSSALTLWLVVLVYLLQLTGVPMQTLAATLFFIVLFAGSRTYYARTAIVVDRAGFTHRGLVRTRRFRYEDIHKVDVLPGPITVYAVRARGRWIHFTSFFSRHQSLVRLLVHRAGLER